MTLPVPKEILDQHVAVLGKTRSGKSSVMRLLVEDLLRRHLPVCIVDPKGDWWGIKLGADGKSAGFPVVIFGGDRADVPINATSGAGVADLFATGNRPCLIDLGGWMPGDRTRFWIDFASMLFRHTKGQRWLAVDEFHNFAPKGKVLDPDAGKMLHWSNRIASEGLGKGLRLLFASQRPQKVHNDSLTSAETLIAMRVIHKADRDAVADWIKGAGDSEGKDVLATVAQMARGEGWAWSPEVHFGPKRVSFPMFSTYDSFREQTVEETKRLKGWAEVDLDDVRQRFAAAFEQAKAEDPKELRKQVAALRADLAKAQKEKPVVAAPVEARVVEKFSLKDGQLARAEKLLEHFEAASEKMAAVFDGYAKNIVQPFSAAAKEIAGAIAATRSAAFPERHAVSRAAAPPAISRPVVAKPRTGDTGAVLGKSERATLAVLAQFPDGCQAGKLALLSGYRWSGGFRNTLSALRTAGYMVGENSQVMRITDDGRAALGDYEPLPVGDALLRHWLTHPSLGKGERAVLEHLASIYPAGLDGPSLAPAVGYEWSGGFRNILSTLRTAGLIRGGNMSVMTLAEDLADA